MLRRAPAYMTKVEAGDLRIGVVEFLDLVRLLKIPLDTTLAQMLEFVAVTGSEGCETKSDV